MSPDGYGKHLPAAAAGTQTGHNSAAHLSADDWATLEAEARTLYERKMHGANGLTLAEDNRIDGILTVDLPAVLAALRRLRERNEQLEREHKDATQGASR